MVHIGRPSRSKEGKIVPPPNERLKNQGDEPFKWNGWRYDDTAFKLNENGQVYLTGKRYWLRSFTSQIFFLLYSGVPFPELRGYAERELGLEISHTSPANTSRPKPPPRFTNLAFEAAIQGHCFKTSTTGELYKYYLTR